MVFPLLVAGKRAFRRIAYFDTAASSASATITIPAGVRDDDLCVLADLAYSGALGVTNVVPTGFTQLGTATDAIGARFTMSWKKLVDSDASSSITGMAVTTQNRKRLVVFRPNTSITNWSFTDGQLTIATGDPAAVTTQASLASAACVAIGFQLESSGATISATNWSPDDADGDSGSAAGSRVLWNLFLGAGVDHTLNQPDYGTCNAAGAVTMEIT